MSFVVKKRLFTSAVVFIFFPRKCPVAVELNLKHRKITNVVEQTHNVSTWSDRSKKLPSTEGGGGGGGPKTAKPHRNTLKNRKLHRIFS